MRVESGMITRHYFAPGADTPTSRPMNWNEGRVSPLFGIDPGMRYDLASGDDGPAELLVLIIEPTGITAQPWRRSPSLFQRHRGAPAAGASGKPRVP